VVHRSEQFGQFVGARRIDLGQDGEIALRRHGASPNTSSPVGS
jgi:hypothetical protein